MNARIKKLREESLSSKPCLTAERARLITDFYRNTSPGELSIPVRRALVFKHLLENKSVYIGPGELIVGERGPAPKVTPTYPEVCTHSLEDLEILSSRETTPYLVDDRTRNIYEKEIIPFWKGRSMRDRIMDVMSASWKNAYDAGVFTEFMEQRAPGHTVLDDKIYKRGLVDLGRDIKINIKDLGSSQDPEVRRRRDELEAMSICSEALIAYAHRHALEAEILAESEQDSTRRSELQRIARICKRVPAHAPEDFWEALQYYWFVHLGVIIEYNTWDAFNPGRLDQHLYPFYKRGITEGSLTSEKTKELLHAFWIKFNNQPAPPKVGVTAEESSTYTDFALINTGGVTAEGTDAVNELSYLILDVIEEMRILQPSSMVQISSETPPEFLERAIRIISTGFGQPSIFNTDAIVGELVRQGKSLEDARNGGASGCVEAGAFGKENYCLTGYFNLTKVLEITLGGGLDPRTGKRIGPSTGEAVGFGSFDELFGAFRKQLEFFVDIKIGGNSKIERLYAEHLPAPFLSLLIDDCIQTGKDYHDGGARYNTSYIQGVGIATITDVLTSIRYNVFDNPHTAMVELLDALKNDFSGFENLRQRFLNKTPKYGNDDDYADDIMRSVFETYFEAVDGKPNTRGGQYRINLLPTTVHVYFGKVVGATADGRKAGEPLSEGISPVQGADRKGPTAVMNSAAKMDHTRTGGTLLNQKFTPQLLADEKGVEKLAHLVRTYFSRMGHHVQFNVVTAETLRKAQLKPEKHRDLIVRVAGYSDYFVDLGRELQDEIIARTEHGSA